MLAKILSVFAIFSSVLDKFFICVGEMTSVLTKICAIYMCNMCKCVQVTLYNEPVFICVG